MMGRPWHYALGALGREGPSHWHDILARDMTSNMAQIGANSLLDLPARLQAPGRGGSAGNGT
jgi:L-lactate dehydrogenase (cytochrome)